MTSGTAADPTGYYLAVENVDYESTTGTLASGGVAQRTTAETTYLAWQKVALLVEAMNVACWKAKAGGTYAASDKYAGCGTGATLSGTLKFHPLMQSFSGSTKTQNDVGANATSLKSAFDTPHITAAMILAKVRAQIVLWNADWVLSAYDTAETTLNQYKVVLDTAATNAATTATSALAELDAAKRWKTAAAAEAAAADADLTTARTLLADLTDEIAPLARAETDARTALATAIAEQAARVVAGEALGTAYAAANASTGAAEVQATGARAVLDAATKTKESVEAQQAFHDSRAEWAEDNLAPAALVYNAAVAADTAAKAAVIAARSKMEDAKDACKVAAFGAAQKAREAATVLAAARAATIADVKSTYDAKAAFPDTGAVGTLCNFPKVGADEPA